MLMKLLSIPDLHWNEDAEMYCDVGINSDGAHYLVLCLLFFPHHAQMNPSTCVTKAIFRYFP